MHIAKRRKPVRKGDRLRRRLHGLLEKENSGGGQDRRLSGLGVSRKDFAPRFCCELKTGLKRKPVKKSGAGAAWVAPLGKCPSPAQVRSGPWGGAGTSSPSPLPARAQIST